MAYIESDLALPRHHKTKRAAKLLGTSRSQIVGSLHFLWAWAMDNAPNGDLTGFDADEIAEESDWVAGGGTAFVEALLNCGKMGDDGLREPGFLERTDDERLVIHHWYDHGGGKLADHRETQAYKVWLKRKGLDDTQENFDLWKSPGKNKRRQVPVSPESSPQTTVSAPAENVAVTSSDIFLRQNNVAECPDIEQSRVDKSRIDKSRVEERRGEERRGEPNAPTDTKASAPTLPPAPMPNGLSASALSMPLSLCERLMEAGLDRQAATKFAKEKAPEAERQLRFWPFREESVRTGAYLHKAIAQKFGAPQSYLDAHPAEGAKKPTAPPPKREIPPDWLPGLSENEARELCRKAVHAAALQAQLPVGEVPDDAIRDTARRLWRDGHPHAPTAQWEGKYNTTTATGEPSDSHWESLCQMNETQGIPDAVLVVSDKEPEIKVDPERLKKLDAQREAMRREIEAAGLAAPVPVDYSARNNLPLPEGGAMP